MRRLKNRLIILLFRLLDTPDLIQNNKDEKQMERWLADSWGDRGFIVYCKMRTRELQKALADGQGMEEHPRDNYVRMVGQRFELARFMLKVKKVYQAREKKNR